MAARAKNYTFTVQGENSLLEAAGAHRSRADCGSEETDHVVELQLVVAALNTLPLTTYTREGWEKELVNFFNKALNLQCMKLPQNQEKGQAVKKFINKDVWITEQERNWIISIKKHWSGIKYQLNNFDDFKAALDGILSRV